MTLPLSGQTQKQNPDQKCPESPIFDECIEAGDILYIPRGWWHEALPIAGEETFHVAVGVHTARITDYIIWTCIRAASINPHLRNSVKYEKDEISGLQESINTISEFLSSEDNLKSYKEALISSDRFITPFNI